MSPAVVSAFPGAPTVNAYCEQCSRHDLDKRECKRCGGCSTVLYCSKDCQRAAWPSHKEICRWRPPSVSELGYATPLALKKVLQEWAETQYYALTTIANAAVYLNGGWDVIRGQPCAIVMHLAAEPYSRDANPSQAFRVMKTRVAHRDSLAALQNGWEEAMSDCAVIEQGVRQDCADTIASNFLGVVPAAIILEGTDIIMLHKWLIFRHDIRHVPDSPTNETTVRAFRDLVHLCAGIIRGGYVFRASKDRAQREPEFGRLVKSPRSQKWKWEKMNVDINVIMTSTDSTTHSGLSNRRLLTLIRPL
ncbi:hypothetical protein OH76DRAFT_1416471 [Lentinus brumalis]|uniref:MYND-type domain-containing protein n=1 Tax=Lentinus brumalis TaxID=2498619 RepID=A0A371DJV1_9APHY|nr:hypothetical protein OH76DRAFT_1416471 [Polyporus brumalis]